LVILKVSGFSSFHEQYAKIKNMSKIIRNQNSFKPFCWFWLRRAPRFAWSVLRLPRPQGERRTETSCAGELGAAKINLLPLGMG